MLSTLLVLLVLPLLLLLLACDVAVSSPVGGSGLVVGDPTFVGLQGQRYQVHGIDGGVYNIVTAPSVQLNARFAFLTGPRLCPVMPSTGRKSAACFAHDGSYLANLALRTSGGDRLLVEAGSAGQGFASVTWNGHNLTVGDSAALRFANNNSITAGSIRFVSTHELSIAASFFQLAVDNSDAFVNLQSIAVTGGQLSAMKRAAPHGLLGQTWRVRGAGKDAIEGAVDDYLIEDGDVFGTAFAHNRFAVEVKVEQANPGGQ